jgi:outer membrane biosynthesis protein TonB
MHEDVDDVIAMRGAMVPPGLNRLVTISLAAHVIVVLALAVMPRDWFAPPEKRVMTISLSGTPGERTTGINPVSGKQVDQVAPPPKRPEVAKPVETTRPDTMKVPAKPAPKPEPVKKPPVETKPEPTRPPTTGKQISKGTAAVDTGAQAPGTGLTFGGGAAGAVGQLDVADFCCPQFLDAMIRQIREGWPSSQPNRGTTIMKFTVLRDGTITDVVVEKPSGYPLLDIASRTAIPAKLRLGLPAQYPENQLVVHLTFPYDR